MTLYKKSLAEAQIKGPEILKELKENLAMMESAEKNIDTANEKIGDDCSWLIAERLKCSIRKVIERAEKKDADWVSLYPLLCHSLSSCKKMVNDTLKARGFKAK